MDGKVKTTEKNDGLERYRFEQIITNWYIINIGDRGERVVDGFRRGQRLNELNGPFSASTLLVYRKFNGSLVSTTT